MYIPSLVIAELRSSDALAHWNLKGIHIWRYRYNGYDLHVYIRPYHLGFI